MVSNPKSNEKFFNWKYFIAVLNILLKMLFNEIIQYDDNDSFQVSYKLQITCKSECEYKWTF